MLITNAIFHKIHTTGRRLLRATPKAPRAQTNPTRVELATLRKEVEALGARLAAPVEPAPAPAPEPEPAKPRRKGNARERAAYWYEKISGEARRAEAWAKAMGPK